MEFFIDFPDNFGSRRFKFTWHLVDTRESSGFDDSGYFSTPSNVQVWNFYRSSVDNDRESLTFPRYSGLYNFCNIDDSLRI